MSKRVFTVSPSDWSDAGKIEVILIEPNHWNSIKTRCPVKYSGRRRGRNLQMEGLKTAV
jgi:hypothetical protein